MFADRYFDWDVGYNFNKSDQEDAQVGDANMRNVALGVGTLTRRAYVGGVEVARARYEETENDPAEQPADPLDRSRLSPSS